MSQAERPEVVLTPVGDRVGSREEGPWTVSDVPPTRPSTGTVRTVRIRGDGDRTCDGVIPLVSGKGGSGVPSLPVYT